MNVADAIHSLVLEYPGGPKVFAARLEMSLNVLYAKANPNTKSHYPSVLEAMRWMSLTGDHRPLRAMNEELGYLPPIPRVSAEVSDMALLESYTKLISELGDFSQKFHLALADGKVTKREVKRLRSEMLDFVGAGEELLNRLEQIAER